MTTIGKGHDLIMSYKVNLKYSIKLRESAF
jgi:hypothetical protein